MHFRHWAGVMMMDAVILFVCVFVFYVCVYTLLGSVLDTAEFDELVVSFVSILIQFFFCV